MVAAAERLAFDTVCTGALGGCTYTSLDVADDLLKLLLLAYSVTA